jgi:quercetin dioxygenase-like cupin family protein
VPYTVAHVDDIEPAGPGNIARFVRRELGVEAFGVNRFDLPPNSAGVEHTERKTGHEEVCAVISGSGHWMIDGEDVPVREGSFIRIDPESTRCPHAGPDGLSFIAMGTRPGSYEPHGPF